MDDNLDLLTQVVSSGVVEPEVVRPNVSGERNYLLFNELLEASKPMLFPQGIEQVLPQHLQARDQDELIEFPNLAHTIHLTLVLCPVHITACSCGDP